MADKEENSMYEYREDTYGQRIAGVYDQWYAEFDPAVIQRLAEFAQNGSALELGIGTGRIAIPLSRRGIHVHGLDASQAMVSLLRSKPGGENIPVTMGNFTHVDVAGHYELVYVVFNTFFSLLTQEEQCLCFQNVSQHLSSGGVFVIEAFVPDMSRFVAGQAMRVNSIGDRQVQIDVSEIELDKQLITSQHLVLKEQGNELYPVKIRYCWPAELDLMAQLAGMRLRERWSNWEKAAFTANSVKHISIYEHRK